MILAVFDDQTVSLAAAKNHFNSLERRKFKRVGQNKFDPFRKATKLLEISKKDFRAMASHAKTVEDGVSPQVSDIFHRLMKAVTKSSGARATGKTR
jgi:hypothetical protein